MKGFNKKVWLVVAILFVMTIGNVYAAKSSFKGIDNFNEVTKIDINTVVRQYVPSKYVKAFNEATIYEGDELATANIRLQILAIGYYESGWVKTICDKPNRDGSLDIGYLQLNSKNIKNKWFMQKFGPDYTTSDELECYLVTCINLYKALYSLYGEDAVYAYNAGETRYLKYKSGKGTLPRSTFLYKKCVSKYTKDIFNEMCQAKTDREEMVAKLVNSRNAIKKSNIASTSRLRIVSNVSVKTGNKSSVNPNDNKPYSQFAVTGNDKKKKRVGMILLDIGISTKRTSGAVGPTLINKPSSLDSLVSSAIVV